MISFPNSPTEAQSFTAEGVRWTFRSGVWTQDRPPSLQFATTEEAILGVAGDLILSPARASELVANRLDADGVIAGGKTFTGTVRSPYQPLTGASIALNFSNGGRFLVVLQQNATISLPADIANFEGLTFIVSVRQDASGGWTLSYGPGWQWPGGAAPQVGQDPNQWTVLVGEVAPGGFVLASAAGPYS